jgi:hypothetical protein
VIAIEGGLELQLGEAGSACAFLVKSRQVDVRGNDGLQGTIDLQTRD